MDIVLKEVTVRDLAEGYEDNEELGVVAFDGKVDVRPPYQREFVYKDAQRDAVIQTLSQCFPLNVMYWAVQGDDSFEIIDGQQRTISICQYVESEFALPIFGVEEARYFHNLQADEKERILSYKLMIYLCSGTDSEKLKWFETINIAGEKLTPQELRNAVYSGPWVTDAKRYFSKNGCPAYGVASPYMKGSPIRQEYLETVLKWVNNGDIEDYMGKHQHDKDAKPLWDYFRSVFNWVETTFPTYRKPMKGLPWGTLYNNHKDDALDPVALETRTAELTADFEVENNKGIYQYLLTGEERFLSLRQFDEPTKLAQYEAQKDETGLAVCPLCGEHFEYKDMAGDHIKPWSKGGKTVPENCQMLCYPDNIKKSNH